VPAEQLASGLGLTEGPLVLPDGRLVFCDASHGTLLQYESGRLSEYAYTGGGPNGAALGSDGFVYVAQMGAWAPSAQPSMPALQRVSAAGTVEPILSEAAGVALVAPNDIAFGPDGRLYLTDSGAIDIEVADRPGRIFACSDDGGELVLELGPVYPNGIAFDPGSRLVWTESTTRRICRLEEGGPAVICSLPAGSVPDGIAIAADGRMYVATLMSGAVTVLSEDGELLAELPIGAWPTNCAFNGHTLFVTAASDLSGRAGTGSVWAMETDAVPLPLALGQL
jgi:gluconolactonase